MAFTFDTTVGGPTANSYISVSGADDYFAGKLKSDQYWDEADDTTKQKALVQACRRLDAERYNGRRTSQSQSLQFPRSLLIDRDGYTIPSNVIPNHLINAQCELALFYLMDEERILTEVELHDIENLTSYNIGPINYGFKNSAKANQLPQLVKDELKSIGPGVWIEENSYILMR